ncbi:hypothetical protein M011DRAFT_258682 [Sporormia fimetaria CBS 119925]|uniref:Uncharacterized protein n=1 Tax=Sporormia fimetaria CBS 119925 TaxID=1340428 RepID=A0A6A6UYT2_9PLEO|nr:hypothetical protein M011DRAFT_258682 [Sporormia fimetaria CBS 119925]
MPVLSRSGRRDAAELQRCSTTRPYLGSVHRDTCTDIDLISNAVRLQNFTASECASLRTPAACSGRTGSSTPASGSKGVLRHAVHTHSREVRGDYFNRTPHCGVGLGCDFEPVWTDKQKKRCHYRSPSRRGSRARLNFSSNVIRYGRCSLRCYICI